MNIFQSLILPRTHKGMIPVLLHVPSDTLLQDTAIIIDEFENKQNLPSFTPSSPKQRFVSSVFELIGDECLVPHAMHYRWSFPSSNLGYITQEFGRIQAPDASPAEQRELSGPAVAKFSGFLPGLGVLPESIPFIESEWLYFLDQLQEHLEHHRYLLGNRPCVGDFALAGPLYAHLFRDPYPGALMKSRTPLVADYVERVMMITPERAPVSSSSSSASSFSYLPDDAIPETLLGILNNILIRNYSPLFAEEIKMLRTFRSTAATAAKKREGVIPRGIGLVDWRLHSPDGKTSVVVSRGAQSFHCFKLQRCVSVFRSLSEADRVALAGVIPDVRRYFDIDMSDIHMVFSRDYRVVFSSAAKL